MSTAIQNAIAELETELAGLDDKRADIEKALAVLQRLRGEGVTASRRVSKRTHILRGKRHQAPRPQTARSAHAQRGLSDPAAKPGAVGARDAAITSRLKTGPATFAEIRAAMPKEPEMTEEQKVRACSNALTRLRLKKEIKQTDDGWALA